MLSLEPLLSHFDPECLCRCILLPRLGIVFMDPEQMAAQIDLLRLCRQLLLRETTRCLEGWSRYTSTGFQREFPVQTYCQTGCVAS